MNHDHDIPLLLAELERLREANKALRTQLDAVESRKAPDSGPIPSDRTRLHDLLGAQGELFTLFLQHMPTMVFIKDAQGRYAFVNHAARHIFKAEPEAIIGCRDQNFLPPDATEELAKADAWVLAESKPLVNKIVVSLPGHADKRHLLFSLFPLLADGTILGLGGLVLDVTRQALTEEALRVSQDRYRIVAENTYNWETWIGPNNHVWYVSPACERITGHASDKFMDPEFLESIMHSDDIPLWRAHREKLSQGCAEGTVEFRIITAEGRERWICHVSHRVKNDQGDCLGLRTSCRDVTENKIMEMRLRHEAFHDHLTGLPNRTLCLDRVAQALERSKRRENYRYAVILLDLDRFKVINESLGHTQGDSLLTAVAKRLQISVRSLDTVARLGSDEFAVILEEISSSQEAIRIVKRIRDELHKPFDVDGNQVRTSASIGIVLSPAIYDKPEDLLRNANIAMRRAKELGRNRFKVFLSRLLDEAVRLMHLEMDLAKALDNDEFFIEYQPILSLVTKQVQGFEALIRWNHPEKGVIPPSEFIPLAEDSGQIIPLGRWVLMESCKAMARWRETNPALQGLSMSVNISAKQLAHQDLAREVAQALSASSLPASQLKLEITESVLMDNPDMAIRMLKRLKDLGVKLSIDDFGTGYSSLSYLQRFPVDTLKVDRSFVSKIGQDPGNHEIVKAVIALAHSLGLDVVAEGVEQEEQGQVLSGLNCEHAQGYFYSRPVAHRAARELVGPDMTLLRPSGQES